MEVRSAFTMPRTLEEHRSHVRIHDALILHWVAVVILVISQFTVIPMLAIIAADTHGPVSHTVSLNGGPSTLNTTTAFKGPPTLNP